ncbi:MAG: ParB/RepB/Spo0J family partition protein, partial [Phycisphaerae bacterium]|nr:ParB/RepB/Spo0J family partition protein [Phycisphaerae bacterium]
MTNTEKNPRRLGRGLSALLGQPVAVAAVASSNDPVTNSGTKDDATLRQLPLERIAPGRFQPRKSFAQDQIDSLAASIRTAGVMQPVLVRESLAVHEGSADYELIAGERRWRAARVAGLTTIPAIIVKLSDVEAAEWGLIENLQREDLGTMERATALASLARQFALTHAQVAERVGLDRSTVTNFIRLTELEPAIQGLFDAKRLSAGHGK